MGDLPQGNNDLLSGSSIEEVIQAERRFLRLKRRVGSSPTALCFSGGGIRSATFCLGVLQGLAKRRSLGTFHYLSTVSGGTYIGTWLCAWISRQGLRTVEDELKKSVEAGQSLEAAKDEPQPIKRLRAYSNFLSPVRGLSGDSVAIAAICARNLLLNWAMLLPILLSVLTIPRIILSLVGGPFISNESSTLGEFANIFLWATACALYCLAIFYATVSSATSRISPKIESRPSLDKHQENGKNEPQGRKSLVVYLFVVPMLLVALCMLVATREDSQTALPNISAFWKVALVIGAMHVVSEIAGLAYIHFKTRMGFGNSNGETQSARKRTSEARESSAPPEGPSTQNKYAVWLIKFISTSALTGLFGGTITFAALHGIQSLNLDPASRATFGFPILLASLGLSSVLRAGLSMRYTSEEIREWWGRAAGVVGLTALGLMILSLLVIQVPSWILSWASNWNGWAAGFAGFGSVLLAIGTAFIGFWSKHGKDIKEKSQSIGEALGVRILEFASLVSLLIIAVAASLIVGCAVKLWMSQSYYPGVFKQGFDDQIPTFATASFSISENLTCDLLIQQAAYNPKENCALAVDYCNGNAIESSRSNQANSLIPCLSHSPNPKDKEEYWRKLGFFKAIASNNFPHKWLAIHKQSLVLPSWWKLLLLSLVLALLGAGLSMPFGANAFSLNAFYGNRLARAYLGASRRSKERNPNLFTGFDHGDNIALTRLLPGTYSDKSVVQSQNRVLYPVINTSLNLVQPSGDRLEWQERKAASFFMTPDYCGSDLLSYIPTKSYSNGTGGISVGRAMAISGAAASPNMGHHSSPFVTMLLAFFNVRLGWWMPNPRRPKQLAMSEPKYGIGPLMSELLSRTGEKTNFVYLSDGGHFENLGLYEMVRRRCKHILVVDAGCDPNYQFEDLENAIRKVRLDFGIEITFEGLPCPASESQQGKRYARGVIHYTGKKEGNLRGTRSLGDGEIFLLKPVLLGNEPHDVLRYADASRRNKNVFPQQPTSDQFFDEAQFESYRRLGLQSLLDVWGSGSTWPDPEPRRLGKSPANSSATFSNHSAEAKSAIPNWVSNATGTNNGLIGMLGSLAPMSQAALLASAITVTAAISVSGTVALSNPELTLKKGEGLALSLSEESGKNIAIGVETYLNSNDGASESPRQIIDRELRELNSTLLEVQRAIERMNGGDTPIYDGPNLTGLETSVKAIGAAATELSSSSAQLKSAASDINAATKLLNEQLSQLVGNLNESIGSLNQSADSVGTELNGILTVLNEIRTQVGQISPRETVRGN